MTTADLIEEFIQVGMKAYKKNSKGSVEASRLDRHQPIVIDNVEFTCWREWTCYKMCEYLKDTIPDMYVECNLDGNDSNIVIEVTDEQQQVLNREIFLFLEKNKI